MSVTPTLSTASIGARPPGRRGFPFIGETISFARNPPKFVADRASLYGPIFRSSVLGGDIVFMVGAEALRFVLGTHRDHFLSGKGWPRGLGLLMGESLMMQNGEVHAARRKQLAPAFFGPAIERYIPVVSRACERYQSRWERLGEFAWYPEMKRLTFAVASELFLGSSSEEEVVRLGALFSRFTGGMQGIQPILASRLPWTPFGRALAARQALLQHVARTIRQRHSQPASDALSILANCGMDEGELAEQVLFLLFAGHESTTALLTYFCMEVAAQPELLERLRHEQVAVGGLPRTLEDLERLPWLDASLLEVERLHPPFIGSFRWVTKPFVFNGCAVEAGTRVCYAISPSHHDPALYPEPGRFEPARFLDRSAAMLRRDYGLVGFGGGARTCIGVEVARLEAKVIAAHLLRGFEWTAVPGQRLDPVYLPSVHPRDGYRVRFQRRTAST